MSGTFYQICTFPNSMNFHEIRQISFTNNKIIHAKEKMFQKDDVEKIIQHLPKQNYKLYSTKELSYVALPNTCDFLECNSSLLQS